jgi:hypothetical protein
VLVIGVLIVLSMLVKLTVTWKPVRTVVAGMPWIVAIVVVETPKHVVA